jgi:hypothetical protein
MGVLIQFQRRAIESLVGEPEAIAPPLIAELDQIAKPCGSPLFVAGVSGGVGTCSGIKNMDVLVLSELETRQKVEVGQLACAFAVLVRLLTPQEAADDTGGQPGVGRQCVELLKPTELSGDRIAIFERTGKIAPYTSMGVTTRVIRA